jgi:hypothetical protein
MMTIRRYIKAKFSKSIIKIKVVVQLNSCVLFLAQSETLATAPVFITNPNSGGLRTLS